MCLNISTVSSHPPLRTLFPSACRTTVGSGIDGTWINFFSHRASYRAPTIHVKITVDPFPKSFPNIILQPETRPKPHHDSLATLRVSLRTATEGTGLATHCGVSSKNSIALLHVLYTYSRRRSTMVYQRRRLPPSCGNTALPQTVDDFSCRVAGLLEARFPPYGNCRQYHHVMAMWFASHVLGTFSKNDNRASGSHVILDETQHLIVARSMNRLFHHGGSIGFEVAVVILE
jgi:hypothetical protein